MKYYANFKDFPMRDWRWPDFSPRELACKGTGKLGIDEDAMDALQALRSALGKPIVINSAYRSPEHNRAVGGAASSQHLLARAFDCRMENHNPAAFEAAARSAGFTSFGYYVKNGFMHIDTRDQPATWGTPWPDTATGWPEETKARPASIKEDGKAQGAAGVATITAIAGAVGAAAPGLGGLGEVAQIVAVVGALALVAYVLWRR